MLLVLLLVPVLEDQVVEVYQINQVVKVMYLLQLLLKDIQAEVILLEVQDIYMVVAEQVQLAVQIMLDQVVMVEQEFVFQHVFLPQLQRLLVVEDQEVIHQDVLVEQPRKVVELVQKGLAQELQVQQTLVVAEDQQVVDQVMIVQDLVDQES